MSMRLRHAADVHTRVYLLYRRREHACFCFSLDDAVSWDYGHIQGPRAAARREIHMLQHIHAYYLTSARCRFHHCLFCFVLFIVFHRPNEDDTPKIICLFAYMLEVFV